MAVTKVYASLMLNLNLMFEVSESVSGLSLVKTEPQADLGLRKEDFV